MGTAHSWYGLHLVLAKKLRCTQVLSCGQRPYLPAPMWLSFAPKMIPGDPSSGFLPKLLRLDDLRQIDLPLSSFFWNKPKLRRSSAYVGQRCPNLRYSKQAHVACAVLRSGTLFFWCLSPKSTPQFDLMCISPLWVSPVSSDLRSRGSQLVPQVRLLVLCVRGTGEGAHYGFLWRWDVGFWELVLFYCVGLGDWTWIIRLGSRYLYTLTHSPALCEKLGN